MHDWLNKFEKLQLVIAFTPKVDERKEETMKGSEVRIENRFMNIVVMPFLTSSDALAPSSFLLLVVMPGATSSVLLLIAMPFVPK